MRSRARRARAEAIRRGESRNSARARLGNGVHSATGKRTSIAGPRSSALNSRTSLRSSAVGGRACTPTGAGSGPAGRKEQRHPGGDDRPSVPHHAARGPLRSKSLQEVGNGRAVTHWNDARLSDLADVLEPVPVQVAVLDATVTHLAAAFEPMPAQIAVLTAAVDRLSCPCHRADLKRPPA